MYCCVLTNVFYTDKCKWTYCLKRSSQRLFPWGIQGYDSWITPICILAGTPPTVGVGSRAPNMISHFSVSVSVFCCFGCLVLLVCTFSLFLLLTLHAVDYVPRLIPHHCQSYKPWMALKSLLCADVPLRNYSLTPPPVYYRLGVFNVVKLSRNSEEEDTSFICTFLAVIERVKRKGRNC